MHKWRYQLNYFQLLKSRYVCSSNVKASEAEQLMTNIKPDDFHHVSLRPTWEVEVYANDMNNSRHFVKPADKF